MKNNQEVIQGIIYKATNIINQKVYIGQTIREFSIRVKYHIWEAKNPQHPFQFAIRKYGEETFSWEIIDTASSIKELNEKEIYWISYHNSTNKLFGYNIAKGGGGGYAISGKSDEEKQKIYEKIAIIHKGRTYWNKYMTPEQVLTRNRKISLAKLGKKKSKKTIERIKLNHADVKGLNNPRARKVQCIETGEIFDYGRLGAIKIYGNVKYNSYISASIKSNSKVKGYSWQRV